MRAAAVVALVATALIALPSSAPTAARDGAGTIVISGGTLVDGTGREPLAGATIVVRDGRVAEVTAGGIASLPADTERIDARGKRIVPGLIDMHVHYQPGWMDALLVEAGLSPREALAAATRTAAAFLGQAQTLGTIEVGKTADLVVLGADPVASIAAIHQVEVVIRDGRVVWRR